MTIGRRDLTFYRSQKSFGIDSTPKARNAAPVSAQTAGDENYEG